MFAGEVECAHECADALLLAGDLTRVGTVDEAHCLADALRRARIPVVAVLGNHDFHSDQAHELVTTLTDEGVSVLDGDAVQLEVDGCTLGVAGVKGFGGGFAGACGTEFGEPEMKAFMGHTREVADRLRTSLLSLDTDVRVALAALLAGRGDAPGRAPRDLPVPRELSAR